MNMDKKFKSMILLCAIGSVIISAAAAASFSENEGTLLLRKTGEYDRTIEYQSEAGSYLNAHLTDEFQTNDSEIIMLSDSDATAEYTVNINTATVQELDALLPGIGIKKAEAIVEYRTIVGGFKSLEELMEVDGIGRKIFEKIRPYCVLS